MSPSRLKAYAFLALIVMLLALALSRAAVSWYRSRMPARMNSDAPRPPARALNAERLLAAIQRRRRAVTLCLAAAVLAYGLMATWVYRGGESAPAGPLAAADVVSLSMFIAFGGPVLLLGVSALGFARLFWRWFVPATLAGVLMQSVVASRPPEATGLSMAAGLLAACGAVAVVAALAVAAARWLPRPSLPWPGARLGWLPRLAGPVILVALGLVAAQLPGLRIDPSTRWSLLGFEFGREVPVAAAVTVITVSLCYTIIADRVQRIVMPLLALALGVVGFTVFLVARRDWVAPLGLEMMRAQDTLLPGLVLGCVLAWLALQAIARAYEHKLFSEAQFQVSVWWLAVWAMVLFVETMLRPELVVERRLVSGLLAATLAALAVGALLTRLFVRPLRTQRRLLVLRVFSHQAGRETLLEDLEYGWRFIGPIVLIGAPDFVGRTIDPAGAVRFLLRLRFGDEFIEDERQLNRRLIGMDILPDPDGRYRVNELLCRNNTWQDAVQLLLASSEAILVDLREYSAARSGTTAELKMLRAHGALGRTVLLVGPATPMQDVARALDLDPARPLADQVRLFDASKARRDELVGTLVRLLPPQPLPGLTLRPPRPAATGPAPADTA